MNQAASLFDVSNSVFAENGETPFGFAAPVTIALKNSYFPVLPVGLTNSGANNLNEGELFLADINVSEGIFYHDVTSFESVLIGLGSTNLLKPYGRTDQIGFERNMDLPKITAGSIEYSGEGDPIMSIENPGRQNLLSVYPNPTSQYIIVKTEHKGKVGIYDLAGRMVSSENIEAGENRIDISSLPKSVYAVKNTSARGIELGRFIKQ
jgi:hypothetical protein